MKKIKKRSETNEIISLLIENKNLKKRNNFCFSEKIKLEQPFFLIFHNRLAEVFGNPSYYFIKINTIRFDTPYKSDYPTIMFLYSGNKRIASVFPSEFLKDINKFIFFNELEGKLLFELKYETNYKKE